MSRSLRSLNVVWLLAGALPTALAQGPVTLAESATSLTPNLENDSVSEILVEAPEPKYVAPTLRDRIGRIWAPVLIDGKGPFRLVLDTGASRSAVTPRVAEMLRDSAATPISMVLDGVTGSAIVPGVAVGRMEVGELLIEATTLPVVADAFGGAEGVLGREGLLDKRIFADFVRDRLVISRSHKERAKSGFTALGVKLTDAGLLAANVRIGTVKVRAIIDTGAQQTVGNLALLRALTRHTPGDSRQQDIIGVTQDLQHGTNVRVPAVSFGALRLQGVRVTFADTFLFGLLKLDDQPTVLIGMDVLGLFDTLIIDYKMREIQIRTRDSSGGLQLRNNNELRHPSS